MWTVHCNPNDPYWTTVRVSIAPFYDPAWVQQILLDAALEVPEILHDPAPLTRFKGQGDSSANCDVWFCVQDYGRKSKATAAVWTSIWTSLERAGIKRTVRRREFLRVEGTETIESREEKAVPDVQGPIVSGCRAHKSATEEERDHILNHE